MAEVPAQAPDKLVVAITARALFDLEKGHALFEDHGLDAYAEHQRSHEDEILEPGIAFPLVRKLLAMNLGAPADAPGMRRYLDDPDPKVAAKAAEILSAWTGQTVQPTTTRVRTMPLPPERELGDLPARMRVTLASGRSFVVSFLLDEAPISTWRVVRLARAGYYHGLTFHRIVPNFVIQGGSPGASEFVGDGPFMRDEFGMRSQTRGTVGISSRGRDTGDAQIYVNLIDNARLDHEYTIFGEVSDGMDVVDAILEGDVIARIEFLT